MSDSLQDKWEAMALAIASANTAWARIENAMATLLERFIGYTTDNIGLHIYFAPNNTETRFKIVDAVARAKMVNPDLIHDLLGEWSKIHVAINRAKETRNRIAHSEINTPGRLHRGKPVQQTRLTASSFDIGRSHQENPRQWPGMSIRDVKATADQFFWLAVRIEEIARYWEAYSLRGTQPPLQEIFARIVEHRRKKLPLPSGQTSPKPKSRPLASQPKPKGPKPSAKQRRLAALEKKQQAT